MVGPVKEIVVHNYRNELPDCMVSPAPQPIEVGIMQSKGAILGNPFYNKRLSRHESIGRFRAYLWNEIQNKDSLVRLELLNLAKVYEAGAQIVLTCCCAPLPCHGDIVKKVIIWIATYEFGV